MDLEQGQLRYAGILTFLIICALLLSGRLVYLFMADTERFPISTIKIAASYQHISRVQIESILSQYGNSSFFSLPVGQLQQDLAELPWSKQVAIERVWPDTLKIVVQEKNPIAIWNDQLMTDTGELFQIDEDSIDLNLPKLNGPENQQKDVLQIYQKLSKILSPYSLHAASLALRENQAWELILMNGIQLRLGKRDIEQRLQRFCKAYAATFADKADALVSVDLRYARGMAVQWKQHTEK